MQVGRYRFLDRVAVGGMAEVYLAVAQGAEGFEKAVVIKRLLPQMAQNRRFEQMFLDEARTMLSLQHGNIVQILDMGRMDGLPFLALEYVDGRDLATALARGKDYGISVPKELAAYIACEVCKALDYAHRKVDLEGKPLHIVHRDVSPSNVFLSFEGGVKVGDFGIAKARDNLDKTDAGVIKGKFSYVSPEQVESQELDGRSDIFSLGTVLYEVCCGQRPFVGSTEFEIVMRVKEAQYTRPSEVVKGFDPRLEAIIVRALQRDRNARYATANEMREDLERYLQSFAARVGDRQLSEFLSQLFSSERRSQSFLFKLPPLDSLPPAMSQVAREGGISEFRHVQTPTPHGRGGATPVGAARATPPALPPGVVAAGALGAARAPALLAAPVAGAVAGAEAGAASGAEGATAVPREVTARAALRDLAEPAVAAPVRRKGGATGWIVGALVLVACGAGAVAAYRHLGRKPPPPPTATLEVTSVPSGAQVLLNGRDTGQRTPASLPGLAVGQSFEVRLAHAETDEASRLFQPTHPGAYQYAFALKPKEEELTIGSTPEGAAVKLDGRDQGKTPLTLRLKRPARFTLVLEAEGYAPRTVVHQTAGDRATLQLELSRLAKPTAARPSGPARPSPPEGERRFGTLEIQGDISAEVQINGKLAGYLPGFRKRLPPGEYRIVVKPRGRHIRHQATVRITERATHRLSLTQ
ncbi:MAG: protein kinase [Deltaproteobacteria bacterium]|nr:protein kinase [Deltaproteobacteria bacterium]